MSRLIDLTGQRFGSLTVLRRADKNASRIYWTCRCECGRVVDIAGNNLRSGHSASCGCQRTPDCVGHRFGRLVVVEKTEQRVQRGKRLAPLWRCRCDCGSDVLVQMDSLTSGSTRSCGCLNQEKLEKMRHACGYVDGTEITRIRNPRPTAANSSGAVGVYWENRTGKWRAGIKFKGRKYNLGRFTSFDEAVAARKKAEAELFGAFLSTLENTP